MLSSAMNPLRLLSTNRGESVSTVSHTGQGFNSPTLHHLTNKQTNTMDTRIKTERSNFTPQARVYHYAVEHVINKTKDDILDFGSGKARYWEKTLGKKAYGIDSYDLSLPDRTMRQYYTVILVSNVLNVQETKDQLHDTLKKIVSFGKSGTRIVWNYPISPRKLKGLKESRLLDHVNHMVTAEGFLPQTTILTGEHSGIYVTTLI